jgi:type I restriction enzyme, R subunit
MAIGTAGNPAGGDDEQVRRLAAGSSNFGHLIGHEPLLVTLGCAAESYVHTDPHAAMVKARLFGEIMAKHLVTLVNVTVPGTRQVDRINARPKSGEQGPPGRRRRHTRQ